MSLRTREVFVGVFVIVIVYSVHIPFTAAADAFSSTSRAQDQAKAEKWQDPRDMFEIDLSSFGTDDHNDDEKPPKPEAGQDKDRKADFSDDVDHFLPNQHPAPETVSNSLRNCELPYFKQLTRIIMESLERPGKHYATIELSQNDLKTLVEFKEKDVDGEKIHEVLEVISGIFSRVQQDEREVYSIWSRVALAVEYNKEIIAVLVIVAVLILVLLVFETRTGMTWRQQFWYLLVGLFIISIPWEWFRLYRKEFAKKQSEIIKNSPRHCLPNEMTISQSISLWMSNLLSWKEGECAKYQEAILVDPVWEVSPSQAFSITVTQFFAKPLVYIADACGKSFNAFFVHIPAQWQPLMFIGIAVMLLLCLLVFTKSRIKFGFFEIGPSVPQPRRLRNEDIEALVERVGNHVEKILRKGIKARDERLQEELPRIAAVHDEKRNHAIQCGVRETGSPEFDIPLVEDIPK